MGWTLPRLACGGVRYLPSLIALLGYVVNVIPKKLHAKIEKKLFGDWPFPPLKVDADDEAANDDGRVGIWKGPLPGGTAELKRLHQNETQSTGSVDKELYFQLCHYRELQT